MSEEPAHIRGIPASTGVVAGPVHVYRRVRYVPDGKLRDDADTDAEWARFEAALRVVRLELDRIAAMAGDDSEGIASAILDAHIHILEDPELRKSIRAGIRTKRKTAATAVHDSFETYVRLLGATNNSYFQERVADLADIRDRLIYRIQHDAQEQALEPVRGAILIAEDLTPSEILELSKQGLAGFAVQSGGATSHATIIARSLGIPGVVGCIGLMSVETANGEEAVIDGKAGDVWIRPDARTREAYARLRRQDATRRRQTQALVGTPCVMRCGTHVTLRANIEFESELGHVRTSGADGIGLLRTESFFMEEGAGTIAFQRGFYEAAVRACDPEPVTIRLFDVGGDKVTDLLTKEANPFLGWRGVRILLDRRDVLREQLDAILDVAGQYPGRIRILVPMVTDPDDMTALRQEVETLQEARMQRGDAVDSSVPVGVMVEVPAVALMADRFTAVSDFFSVGTNDLTQYTFAVDRGNPKVSGYFRHHHPAVYRLIATAVNAADGAGIPVAVCGELASDPDAAAILVGLGIRELSMAPSAIGEVKARLLDAHITTLSSAAMRMIS
jgi:phosphoenolpyruvate-protein phosphotransferase (PTS system enzyme I)